MTLCFKQYKAQSKMFLGQGSNPHRYVNWQVVVQNFQLRKFSAHFL